MLGRFKLSMLTTLTLFSTIVSSAPTQQKTHIVIAPDCLLKQMHGQFKTLASKESISLVEISDYAFDKLINAKHQQRTACGGFKDITDYWQGSTKKASSFLAHTIKSKPLGEENHYNIIYQEKVNKLLKQINPTQMWNDLTSLTAFPNRYSNSQEGVKAALWIKAQVQTIAEASHHRDVSYKFIKTGPNYKQPSLVVKLGDSNAPGIVIGGHMDTLDSLFKMDKKPGADDDGSGSITVLETARVILNSGMTFKKPIYFIWYAAEEMGLVGSTHVVEDFKRNNIPIAAALQLDMTGYAYKNDKTLWLIDDKWVNKNLTDYLEKLINTYVKQPVKRTACGYACSDHASWNDEGYPAAMPFEASFGKDNPYIHTEQDQMAHLSLEHMTDYTKLAIAFALEMAEPQSE